MRAAAAALLRSYLRLVNDVPVPVALDPSDAVNKAVTCNDGPSSTDPDFWNRQLEELRAKAPAYFHDRLELNCTAQWGGPTTVKPDVAAAARRAEHPHGAEPVRSCDAAAWCAQDL